MAKTINLWKTYDEEYQSLIAKDAQASAAVIIPLLVNFIHPKSVVDIGCGTGAWLKECINLGIADILGIDGPWIKPELLLIPQSKFIKADINKTLHIKRSFDMALCLEVAEHLPASSSSALVRSLVKLSPTVVFSSAIPGQRGTNHINEQWLDYWVKIFNRHKYVLIDALRPVLWDRNDIEWWYAQNIVIFVRKDQLPQYKKLLSIYQKLFSWPYRLIHPRFYHDLKMTIHDQKMTIHDLQKISNMSLSKSISVFFKILKDKIKRILFEN